MGTSQSNECGVSPCAFANRISPVPEVGIVRRLAAPIIMPNDFGAFAPVFESAHGYLALLVSLLGLEGIQPFQG
jgi:hypothetical protein